MALHFAPRLPVVPPNMEAGLSIATTVGNSLDTNVAYKGCVVKIEDKELHANLVMLDMKDFDVNLSMNWLAAYHTSMDCLSKIVMFAPVDQPSFQILGLRTRRYELFQLFRLESC